jgi:beta-glucanase (GH16 family)
MKKHLYIVALLFIIFSCSKEENTATVMMPWGLTYEVEVSDSMEGLVTVSANANSTNYYTFEFFHSNGSTIIESIDGEASYLHSESGDYKVVIKAHATYEHYIEGEEEVSVVLTQGSSGVPISGYSTPLSYPGYDLVWNDEFEGSSLSNDWTYEIGTGSNGWGNNELQYYRSENTKVEDGYLIIQAKNESYGGRNYTSSRIITQNAQSFKYGRIDIRAALPFGQGLWPAVWMLGSSFSNVGWPACGEIDIMEMVGSNNGNTSNNTVHGTAHWDNGGQHAQHGGSNTLSTGKYADEFHVFSIIWDSNSIKWYRDDILYEELDITSASLSEFHQPFFFIFNVAVGGNWPGSPNANTIFPQQMTIDYVRVFQ